MIRLTEVYGILNWAKDKTKRVSLLRMIVQINFLILIFLAAIITVWKGLLLILILGATFILGRFFCAWICPFGLYMDLITLIRKQLGIRHWSLPEKLNKSLHTLRYIILLAILTLVLTLFLASEQPTFDVLDFLMLRSALRPFTVLLAPLETLIIPFKPPFGALLEIFGQSFSFPYVGEIMALTGGKVFALPIGATYVTLVLLASFKIRRFWCRYCPTGISLAAINRFSQFKWVPLLRLNKDERKCTKCGICKRVCPVQVTEVYESKGGDINTSMCTLCLRCVEMCPYPDCLRLRLRGITLFKSRSWL